MLDIPGTRRTSGWMRWVGCGVTLVSLLTSLLLSFAICVYETPHLQYACTKPRYKRQTLLEERTTLRRHRRPAFFCFFPLSRSRQLTGGGSPPHMGGMRLKSSSAAAPARACSTWAQPCPGPQKVAPFYYYMWLGKTFLLSGRAPACTKKKTVTSWEKNC